MAYCRITEECRVYLYQTWNGYHFTLRYESGIQPDVIHGKTAEEALVIVEKLIGEGTWDTSGDLIKARLRLLSEIHPEKRKAK